MDVLNQHRKIDLPISATILVLFMLVGCHPKGVGPTGPSGTPLTWAEMNIEQRKAHMKLVVLPRAAVVFRTWRPERYATVECNLCHGIGVHYGNFRMPSDHLPRLSGDLLLTTEREKHPKTTQLKLDRLVPEMANALGIKSFNLITRRGFGCYSCHLGPEGSMYGN